MGGGPATTPTPPWPPTFQSASQKVASQDLSLLHHTTRLRFHSGGSLGFAMSTKVIVTLSVTGPCCSFVSFPENLSVYSPVLGPFLTKAVSVALTPSHTQRVPSDG